MIPLGYRKKASLRVNGLAVHNSSEFSIGLVNIFEYIVRNLNFSTSKRLLDPLLFYLLDCTRIVSQWYNFRINILNLFVWSVF